MSDNIKYRITSFLNYLKIGQGKFEEICGISNGTVNNIKRGISSPNLAKISNAYPDLSLEWLITGKGNMLKSVDKYSGKDGDKSSNEEIEQLKAEINMLRGENRILRELHGLGERKGKDSASA
ncbi:helix-turn-helix transcriptional regulator [Parabacteroides sp. Marseille-P3160]|uniref:helix-turn-helix transcriptional regulator n=1 Tax=Parabacteroides sp. Marseille-P3160 TaxID=1917887 RepID=UPI0009B98306|nr:helix-turn-helix transcriptional regulator [Parabacteroides sp. Marseille-P3160]